MRYVVCMLMVLGVAGCASSPARLQQFTALHCQVSPDTVAVRNVQRSAMTVAWDASIPGDTARCTADDMVRQGQCIAQGQEGRCGH